MTDEELNKLCDRLKAQSHTTGREIIKHLSELSQKPYRHPNDQTTLWEAITFAGAAMAELRENEKKGKE